MASGGEIDTNSMTLTRFVLNEQMKIPNATGNLTLLLNSLLTAIKAISTAVRRAGFANLLVSQKLTVLFALSSGVDILIKAYSDDGISL